MNRNDRRAAASKARRDPSGGAFVLRDGKKLIVIRPAEPEIALALAHKSVANNSMEEFQDILRGPSGYTFRGYLRSQGCQGLPTMYISDEHGVFQEELQPGDSFVTEDAVSAVPEA